MLPLEAKEIIHNIRGDLNKLRLAIEVVNATGGRADIPKVVSAIHSIDEELTRLEKVLGSDEN
jgi:hypothetical protein